MTRPSRDTSRPACSGSRSQESESLRTALLNAVASAEAMRDVLKSMAERSGAASTDGPKPSTSTVTSTCNRTVHTMRHIRANVPPGTAMNGPHAERGHFSLGYWSTTDWAANLTVERLEQLLRIETARHHQAPQPAGLVRGPSRRPAQRTRPTAGDAAGA
jgi:hypothetical protein